MTGEPIEAEKKKRIKIFKFDEVVQTGRTSSEVGPHQTVVVVPSPEGHIHISGTKCEHGGYIPATHVDPNRAPYCSVCYPYLLKERV